MDLLRYSERTTSKTPTRQKLAIWGKLTHHYEDPVRLKAQFSTSRGRPIPEPSKSSNKRPRKKINETYEPVGTKGRRRTFTDESYSSDGYHRDRCSTLFKILAFVGFFVGLAALALVVMITLGMLSLPSCHDCKKEIQGIHGPALERDLSTHTNHKKTKKLRKFC